MINVYLSVGLIIILFTLEYYLRPLSIKIYHQKYGQHIVIPNYPTNHKQSGNKSKLKFFIFIAILAIISTLILMLSSVFIKRFFLGFLLTGIGSIIGIYTTHLISYYYVIKNPEAMSGQVNMSLKFILKICAGTFIYILIPFIICAFYIKDPFIYGSILGLIYLYNIINTIHNKYPKNS